GSDGRSEGAQRLAERISPAPQRNEIEEDAAQLQMSTLSFQDYVRERMLKRRHAELHNAPVEPAPAPPPETLREALAQRSAARAAVARAGSRQEALRDIEETDDGRYEDDYAEPAPAPAPRRAAPAPMSDAGRRAARPSPAAFVNAPVLHDEVDEPAARAPHSAQVTDISTRRAEVDMMNELRSMKGLIEERFGALAFMEKLQRQPRRALLAQKLLDVGFSPALIRKLVDALPADAADENAWAAGVLERNLLTNENELPLEDQGGVYALIGSTGVG